MFSSRPTVIRPSLAFRPSLSIPSHLFTGWGQKSPSPGSGRWTSSPAENAGEKDVEKMPSPPCLAASKSLVTSFSQLLEQAQKIPAECPAWPPNPLPRPRESTSAVLNPESNQKKCILVSWFPVKANCCLPSTQAIEVENSNGEFPDVYICFTC